MDDLKAICKCGHQRGEHTGYGICTKCECKEFTAKPKPKEKLPSRLVKGQEVLKKIIDDGHHAIENAYGIEGICGFDSALGTIMQPMANIGDVAIFIASPKFDRLMQSIEGQLGFLCGVRVGMKIRELMSVLERGGDIEGCEVRFNPIHK